MISNGNDPAWKFDKIFGREKEIQQLESLVQQQQQKQQDSQKDKSSLVVLHGVAGSGKSSLIRSYPWKEKGYVFASGKFEEHRKSEPYSAVIEALNDLVDQWVVNNKQAPVCQMGGFHKLLVEDIEFLKNILPKPFIVSGACLAKMKKMEQKETSQDTTTEVEELEFKSIDMTSAESVNAAFRRILSFLCTARPVVLFLDDIHWADQSSLEVLKALSLCGRIDGLLVAVSYRDEEVVCDDHPVNNCLNDIKEQNPAIQSISVADLDVDSVSKVVASITKTDPEETLALAEVIHNKTAGNPFFVVQFLQLLRDENFLTFSYNTFKWEWGDVDKLQSVARVSDNVADVVAATLHRLPEATRVTLKVASCLGKVMPLELLCEYFDGYFVDRNAGHTCCQALLKIQTIGLQNVLDCAVKRGILIRPDGTPTYMWSHDKLQHVTYSLIPESMRPSLHMRLGKLLWKMSAANPDAEWMVFMAADQLNRYSSHESSPSLGREAARLNLEAAKLSLSKSALFPAMDMLRAGAKNIGICNQRWADDYSLCLELYSLLAEVGVQLGQHKTAMDAVREVEENAKSLDDKFRSQCVMLKSVTSGNNRDYALGVEKTLEILRLYGEKLPSKLLPGQLYIENQRLRSKLPGGKLEGLMDLPDMVDARSIKVTRLLLRHLGLYALLQNSAKKGVGALAAVRALNIACTKGVSSDTPLGILWFAMNLKMEGHYKEACEYGEFAIKLVDKFPQELGSLHGSVRVAAYCSIFPSVRPFNNTMDGMLEGYRIGLRSGETEKAINAVLGYSWAYLCIGLPLGPLHSDLLSYGREANQLGVPFTVQILFKILRQAVVNLQENGRSDPTLLKGKVMDQDEELSKVEGQGKKMTSRDMHSFRLLLACIYNDWETAEKMIDILEPYLAYDGFTPRAHLRSTYMGLASLVLSRKTGGKKKHRSIAKKVIKSFKSEVKKGSVNAHPILVMLEAEESPSKEHYERAIKICARLGLVHHEAYLCERAAVYFLEQNDKSWGEFYLAQAYTLYSDWGATGKVTAMKKEYGKLIDTSSDQHASGNSALKGRTRYSARDSSVMTEVSWSSFSTGSGDSSRSSLRSSVSSTSSSEEGKSDEGSSSFRGVVDWV